MKEAYTRQALLVVDSYLNKIDEMVQNLSQWEKRIEPSEELQSNFTELTNELGKAKLWEHEPYRRYLSLMHRALREEQVFLRSVARFYDRDVHDTQN